MVDSFDEIEALGTLARRRQRVLVRVTPGIDGQTHAAVEDQKFGFSLCCGAAAETVRRMVGLPGYANRIRVALRYECGRHRLPVARLTIEPGRSIVATAGVTLYRVITVKHGPTRTFVAVDGGMSEDLSARDLR